jgi:hypothetical protein
MKACSNCSLPTRFRGVGRFFSWILPSAILVLMPKCPVCLAAYIALGAGVGLSLPSAENLRVGALALSGAVLSALVIRVAVRFHPSRARPQEAGGSAKHFAGRATDAGP